ncbi:MAG: hypothetical protein GJ680_00195 [Alteromonadaceae bacterium]|nr:hypothetical protein [Alteromonadaceae bacterium]
MESALYFFLNALKTNTRYSLALFCCSVLALSSTLILIIVISQNTKVGELFNRHLGFELTSFYWLALIMFAYFLQEAFTYLGKKLVLKISSSYEIYLYRQLVAEARRRDSSDDLLESLRRDVPCVMRGVRSLLHCLTPVLILSGVITYFYFISPLILSVLAVSFLVFLLIQIRQSQVGAEAGIDFNSSNIIRSRSIAELKRQELSDEKLNSFWVKIDDYRDKFMKRLLSIEYNRFLTSSSVITIFLIMISSVDLPASQEQIRLVLANNVELLFLGVVFATQISNVASSLSSFFIMKEHFNALYEQVRIGEGNDD